MTRGQVKQWSRARGAATGYGRRMGQPDPVVTPEGWLHRGDCYVRGDGVQLAIFGAIPGERARIRFVGGTGRQERARWLGPAGRPHADRVSPPCDRFAPCGRCPIMHIRPVAQDVMRRQMVEHAFGEAGLPPRCEAPIRGGDTDVLHTLSLVTGYSDQRHPRLGVAGHDGREVVPIPGCLVTTPSLREVMKVVAHHTRELEIWPFDGRQGTLRAVMAREAPDGEVSVLFVAARPNNHLGDLAERIASAHAPISGVLMHRNDASGPPLVVGEDGALGVSLLYGKPTLTLPVGTLRLKVGWTTPFPNHVALHDRLQTDIVALLAPEAGDAAVDIGPGDGALAMLLAQAGGWALGIVPHEAQALFARDNAAANGVRAEFAAGDIIPYVLEDTADRLKGRRPLFVVDVGTRGLKDDALAAIAGFAPRRIVLRGTNPRSLARNTAAFVARGWELKRVLTYDVAPHTPFVEIVAVLHSADPTAPERRAPRRRTVRG